MEFVWVLIVIGAIWYFVGRNKSAHQNAVQDNSVDPYDDGPVNYTEEQVLSYQTSFENRLYEEIDFPDSIAYSKLYIFNNLMEPWFQKLSGKYRYDEQMVQKIRNDWIEYMSSMKDLATCGYLSMEFDDEKGEEYEIRARNAAKKVRAIENAFASYIGGSAEAELKQAMDLDYGKINKRGEVAPEGKRFTILGDLIDETD